MWKTFGGIMNELDRLKNELQEVINKQIRLETIKQQAKQQCEEIEHKYNIQDEQQLKELLDKAESDYEDALAQACAYVADAKLALQPYEGML